MLNKLSQIILSNSHINSLLFTIIIIIIITTIYILHTITKLLKSDTMYITRTYSFYCKRSALTGVL